jgi:transposase
MCLMMKTVTRIVIKITHGYSKAHRPDLKQVVQEIIVSQNGGVPLACKNWDGNSADTAIFIARSKALVASLKKAKRLNILWLTANFILKPMPSFYHR